MQDECRSQPGVLPYCSNRHDPPLPPPPPPPPPQQNGAKFATEDRSLSLPSWSNTQRRHTVSTSDRVNAMTQGINGVINYCQRDECLGGGIRLRGKPLRMMSVRWCADLTKTLVFGLTGLWPSCLKVQWLVYKSSVYSVQYRRYSTQTDNSDFQCVYIHENVWHTRDTLSNASVCLWLFFIICINVS